MSFGCRVMGILRIVGTVEHSRLGVARPLRRRFKHANKSASRRYTARAASSSGLEILRGIHLSFSHQFGDGASRVTGSSQVSNSLAAEGIGVALRADHVVIT